MLKIPVEFRETDDMLKFVDIVNRFDCDIDLKYGSYLVDAKSLMGVLSLSRAKNIEMQIHSENCDDILNSVKTYIN